MLRYAAPVPKKPNTITDPRSGATLPLKGYGAQKGTFEVRRGIDLTKPIAAQAKKAAAKPS